MSYTEQYIEEAKEILCMMDRPSVERTVDRLAELRERGGRFEKASALPRDCVGRLQQ